MTGDDAQGLYNVIKISIFENLHIPYVVLLKTFLKPRIMNTSLNLWFFLIITEK